MKKTIAITIDIDVYDEAKLQNLPLSRVLNDALRDYVVKNRSPLTTQNMAKDEKLVFSSQENKKIADDLHKTAQHSLNPNFYVKNLVHYLIFVKKFDKNRIKTILDLSAVRYDPALLEQE